MRLFKRETQKAVEETPQPAQETDLHERARPALEAKAANNPRLAALLAEIDRGDARRHARAGIAPPPSGEPSPAPEPLHAHEITGDDAALIRVMAGAHFGDDATVTLPSGKTITGAEMRRWVEEQQA